MKTKRTLSLLIAFVMLVSLMVGCGKNPTTSDYSIISEWIDIDVDVSDDDSMPEDDSSTDKTKKTKTTTTRKKDNSNIKGEVVAGAPTVPFDKTVKFTLFINEHANQPIKQDGPNWKVIKKLTNVELDVDIAVAGSGITKLTTANATGKMYDIVRTGQGTMVGLNTKLFIDMTDKMKTDVPNYWNLIKDDSRWKQFTVNGRYYGLFCYQKDYPEAPMPLYIRHDLVDEYVKGGVKGIKTWEDWFNAMKVLKEKVNPSTSAPYTARTKHMLLEYWSHGLGQRYNIYYDYHQKEWVCGVLTDQFREYVLPFMAKCYAAGVIDKNFDAMTTTQQANKLAQSQSFFLIDNGPPAVQANGELEKGDDSKVYFAPMPLLEITGGPKKGKKQGLMFDQTSQYTSYYALSSQETNQAELLAFMNWCYSEEGYRTNTYGEEGVTYEVDANGNPYTPKKIWKEFEKDAIPKYQWMSKYGLGMLCFAPYYGDTAVVWEDWKEDEKDLQFANTYTADHKAGYFQTVAQATPDVSSTQRKQYEQLNDYILKQTIQFVKGRNMSEYNNFLNELSKRGIDKFLKDCNKKK